MSKAIIPTPFGPMVSCRRPARIAPIGIFGLNPFEELAPSNMKIDVKETDEKYEVFVDFPGVDKKDIDVSIDEDVMTISYEQKQEKEESGEEGQWIRRERCCSAMKRSFTLPNSDESATTATMKDGVLEIIVPKKQQEETGKTTIEIS